MICCVVRIKALAGQGDAFVKAFTDYAETVKADEPGTRVYTLNKDRDEADLFWAVEFYDSPEAREVHAANFVRLVAGAGHPVDGHPVFQTFDTVAGYIE